MSEAVHLICFISDRDDHPLSFEFRTKEEFDLFETRQATINPKDDVVMETKWAREVHKNRYRIYKFLPTSPEFAAVKLLAPILKLEDLRFSHQLSQEKLQYAPPYHPGECFVCHKQGHWGKDCPTRARRLMHRDEFE